MTDKQIATARAMIIKGAKWSDVMKKYNKPIGYLYRHLGSKKEILASVKPKKTKKAA